MGENLIILRADGSRVPLQNRRTATRVTSAKQKWALNAEDTVELSVESPFPQTYFIGDKMEIFGRVYTMNRLPKVKKTGMHEFHYDLEFEGVQYDLFRIGYDVNIDTTNNTLQDLKGDSLTGDLRRFMTVLIANANRVFPGKWVLGVCPETQADKTLTFGESDNCLSVLQTLCNEKNFNCEFEIESVGGVNTIHIKERVGQTLPYTFEYGKGKGLYALHRDNVSSSNIVTRLKVYGSTSNITLKYRADRLCLPGKSKAQSYIENADMVAKYGVFEGRKNFDDIKPTFTGHISGVNAENVLVFADNSFPFDLNETEQDGVTTKYLIPGLVAKVHFNTGNLAGYEFEVSKYDHTTKTFTLIKQTDEHGNTFPSADSPAFQFAVGDEYKVIDIAYSPEIEHEAEARLLEVGTKYYEQNCQPKVQYSLSVTKQWVEKTIVGGSAGIMNVFAPGDYLPIRDADIDVDKAVRIKSFTRNILDPYDYALTISDISTSANVGVRVISELLELDKILTINNLKDPARARANWRSSREVLDMIFDPEGNYYTDKIKPNSIDTLMLSVGAKSMQFGLTNTVIQPNYGGNPNVVKWKGGVLTHYTINEEHAVSWILADGELSGLESGTPYYIYVRCEKGGNAGNLLFSPSAIKVEEDANLYHFWIGVLNSVDMELHARSVSLTYGFTTINGRFIKTGRIESADGLTYFDLDDGEIGGRIVFSSNGSEKTLEQLGQESLESKNFINNTLPGLLSEIQAQLDGQIEQFFDTYDPTLDNAPANGWTTVQLKETHLGDLFYNTESGGVFRFVKENGIYRWQQLSDAVVAQALALAQDALELAKKKARIFTATPTTPYEVGDLWVQGGNGDIMRCKTTRLTGSYTSSDWEKASKYTDNTAFNNFVNGTYANNLQELTNQIDGKIETWFQTSNPWNSWASGTEYKHVGDMWYNPDTHALKRYAGADNSNTWVDIVDAKALEAYEKASQAKDTADGKRRVFVATPYPPYDIGDLWVNGTDLKRCATSRQTGSYNVNDWVVAVNYDNTKTVIDGGIVTSGTVQVAGDTQSILAGMTGKGTAASSIRFWAGASFENRATAPYRVQQDGKVIMTNADVQGIIRALSGTIGGFEISQGRIGVEESYGGLTILDSFIKFSQNGNVNIWSGIGSNVFPDSMGYPCLARFEYSDNQTSYGNSAIALYAKCRPGYPTIEHSGWYNQKAIHYDGNMYGIGGVAQFFDGFRGEAWSDTIQSLVGVTHYFHFTSTANNATVLTVNLPTTSQVSSATGGRQANFDLEIVCDTIIGSRKIRITPPSGTSLYNKGGSKIDYIELSKGNALRLRYDVGYYMVVSLSQ